MRFKKFIVIFALFLLIIQTSGIGILLPNMAKAQLGPAPVPAVGPGIGATITGDSTAFFQEVWKFIQKSFIFAGSLALRNMLVYMVQSMAYDAAVYVASGGKGQDSLIFQQGWGDYMSGVMERAGGEFIGTLADATGFKKFGFDLCAPSADILLGLQFGLLGEFKPPAPKCDWAQISANWQAFANTFKDERDFLNHFKLQFEPAQNSIGMFLKLNDRMIVEQNARVLADSKTREEGNGWKGLTGTISNYISTPPDVINKNFNERVISAQKAGTDNIYAARDVMNEIPEQILQIALSTFVNTLVSRLTQNIFKGIFGLGDLLFGSEEDVFGTGSMTQSSGIEAAQERFSYLNKTNLEFSSSTYSPITEFAACPTENGTPNNCVIDNKFQQAIMSAQNGEPLTVGDAIEKGLLNSEWPLIPPGDLAGNQDPFCFSRGYCYSNLVKLRKAAIIPVGWEIAASRSPTSSPVSLQTVIDNFYNCAYDEKGNVVFDPENYPWCHLVDPNWVLKEPLTQCRAMTYTQAELAGSGSRYQMCTDSRTCIDQDEDGNCTGGWAYCTQEKNAWRFNGDQCPGQYDSCKSLTRSDGASVNYLINTVDYGNCSADNVGCNWYSTKKDVAATLASGGIETWDENSKIYFDKDIYDKTCPDTSEGCTELIRTASGLGTNLIPNSSFEYFIGDLGALDRPADFSGWEEKGQPIFSTATAYEGAAAAYLFSSSDSSDNKFSQIININPQDTERYFIYSGYFYLPNALTSGQKWELFAEESVAPQQARPRTGNDYPNLAPMAGSDYLLDSTTPAGTWVYKADLVKASPFIDQLRLSIFSSNSPASSGQVYVDSLKLEEIFNPTDKATDYTNYGANNLIYLAKAPNYYNCYDADLGNDSAECAYFAKKCDVKEVGCELFSPSLNGAKTGEFDVPGQVFRKDYCPSECVGYETFSKTETNFENLQYPVYFIPQTGKACSAQNAGCDQFTNLDTLAAGGEGIEYYSYLRQCIKPDAVGASNKQCGAFYTWEGSEVSGYQLQTYILKKSEDGVDADGQHPDLTIDDNPNEVDNNVIEDFDQCNADIFTAKSNPDCREFYYVDEASRKTTVTYHLFTNTISCSEDCHPYRRTLFSASDCTAHNGTVQNIEGQDACIYYAIPNQGVTCGASDAGCREYVGNAGANYRNVFTDDFSGVYDGWSCGTNACELSSEGVYIGDTSLKITNQSTRDLFTETTGNANGISLLTPGKAYSLSFWAKSDSNASETVKFGISSYTFNLNLTPVWREYTFGPMNSGGALWEPSPVDKITFSYTKNVNYYIDKVIVRELTDNVYVIKDSWKTPDSCNQTLDGDYAAQAMLGCSENLDRIGTTHYLKSFSNICQESAVGCEALIDTKNSSNPFAETFSLGTTVATSEDYKKVCNDLAVKVADIFSATPTLVPTGVTTPNISWNDSAGKCYFNGYWDWTQKILEDQYGERVTITVTPDYFDVLLVDSNVHINSTDFGNLAITAVFTFGGILAALDTNTSDSNSWSYENINDNDSLEFKALCTVNLLGTWDSNTTTCSIGSENTMTTENDELIYLVNDDQYSCPSSDASCTAFGVPEITNVNLIDKNAYSEITAWTKAFYLNDPDIYPDVLCDNSGAGCDSYTTTDGEILYFRNPGDRLCEYREEQSDSGQTIGKWYQKGTNNLCAQKDSTEPFGKIVTNDVPAYDGWVGECRSQDNLCTKFIDPLDTSNTYELGKSYYFIKNENLDTSTCNGEVSLKKGCILFNDTSNPVLNYDVKASYSESAKAQDPYALVSPVAGSAVENGCKASNTDYIISNCTKSGDTCTIKKTDGTTLNVLCSDLGVKVKSTGDIITEYQCLNLAIDEGLAGRVLTKGIDCLAGKNDANLILKVKRDTVCSEWLTCRNQTSVWDEATSQFKYICTDIDACNQFEASGSTNADSSQCASFVPTDDNPKVFSEEKYVKRGTSWNDSEYTGYSILGVYPLQYLDQVNYSKTQNKFDMRLARVLDYSECIDKSDGVNCGNGKGECINGVCLLGIHGESPFDIGQSGDTNLAHTFGSECRGYPESNSPFPYLMKDTAENPIITNFCEAINFIPQDCDCSYQKLTYGNGSTTKYFNIDTSVTKLPQGYCSGGYDKNGISKTGYSCLRKEDCTDDRQDCLFTDALGNITYERPTESNGITCTGYDPSLLEDGTCQTVDAGSNRYIGWEGYCLEHDLSLNIENDQNKYYCETWYPIDMISGKDIFNQFEDAGFKSEDNLKYCILQDGFSSTGVCEQTGKSLFGKEDDKINKGSGLVINNTKLSNCSGTISTIQQINIKLTNSNAGDSGYHFPVGSTIYLNPENNWQVGWVKNRGDLIFSKEIARPDGSQGFWDESSGRAWDDIKNFNNSIFDDSACNATNNAYIAVKAVFDVVGNFIGFDWGLCAGIGGDDDGWIHEEISFIMQNACIQLVDVSADDGENKAYTNRIWEMNDSDFFVNISDNDVIGNKWDIGGTSSKPYDVDSKNELDQSGRFVPRSFSDDASPFGKIWQANGGFPIVSGRESYFIQEQKPYIYIPTTAGDTSTVRANTVITHNFDEKCITYSTINGQTICIEVGNDKINIGFLKKIYAKVYKLYEYKNDVSSPIFKYIEKGSNDLVYDLTVSYTELPEPQKNDFPMVAGFDDNGVPVMNTLTITTNQDGQPSNQTFGEIISNGGRFEANLNFYAWANTDHMPLTQINVDFGRSGSSSTGPIGKYQNRKKVCALETSPAKECYAYDIIPGQGTGDKTHVEGLTCNETTDCPATQENCASDVTYEKNTFYGVVQDYGIEECFTTQEINAKIYEACPSATNINVPPGYCSDILQMPTYQCNGKILTYFDVVKTASGEKVCYSQDQIRNLIQTECAGAKNISVPPISQYCGDILEDGDLPTYDCPITECQSTNYECNYLSYSCSFDHLPCSAEIVNQSCAPPSCGACNKTGYCNDGSGKSCTNELSDCNSAIASILQCKGHYSGQYENIPCPVECLSDKVGRCSANPAVICDTDTDCGLGDTCDLNIGSCEDNSELFCTLNDNKIYMQPENICVGSGFSFGNSPQACFEGYYHYSTTYTCTDSDIESLESCDLTTFAETDTLAEKGFATGCYDSTYLDTATGKTGACVYQPRVQVIDNWGWCNGDLYGEGDNGDDCNSMRYDNWTYYNGKIIIFP